MKKMTQLETYRKALEAIPQPLSNYRGGAPGCGACGFIPRGPGEEHYADCWWVGIKKALSAQGEQGTPPDEKAFKAGFNAGLYCGRHNDDPLEGVGIAERRWRENLKNNAPSPTAQEPHDLRQPSAYKDVPTIATNNGPEPPTETQERCPKCKTEVEWVVPPIPGAKPFFQCQDPDCDWMGDDNFPVTKSKEGV